MKNIAIDCVLFDKCNMNCAHCFQNHTDKEVDREYIRNLAPLILSTMKEEIGRKNPDLVMFSMRGGELFLDSFEDSQIEDYTSMVLEVKQEFKKLYPEYKDVELKINEDGKMEGHERTIYPMVLGKSKDDKFLIRGYHLNGWSVSNGGNVEKEWRLFRADRILNMTFTGAFFRLAPAGYNQSGDKAMAKILTQADFNKIRNQQQQLLQKNQIDTVDRVILNKIKNIEAKNLNYNLQLSNPWKSNVIPKKDAKSIRMTFAKPVIGNGQWIAIVGTSIEPNNIFKLKVDNEVVASYKSVKWVMADELDRMKILDQQVEFKTYMFLKGN